MQKIREQTTQIEDLLKEGENLSKLHLKLTTIIKKQKEKEESRVQEIAALNQKLEELTKSEKEKSIAVELNASRLKQLEDSL